MTKLPKPVFPARAVLGECPLWCVREQVLWWVDILAPSINRFDPATGQNTAIAVDEHIGCIGLREKGGFIAGMRSGIWLLDAAGRKERFVANPQADTSQSRFNDGRVDPWGRFWAGTMYEPRDRADAALYRVDETLACIRMAGDVIVSNGVAFSPDLRTAYHADTRSHVVYRYPMDPQTGKIGEREVFLKFPQGHGRPDGAAVDVEGCYWSALFDGGRIARFSPQGRLLAEYRLPARCPTMCAFGGEDLRTLYVTTARHERGEEELAAFPLSGDLFAMRVDVAGQPEPLFKG